MSARMRAFWPVLGLAVCALLAACGEKPQTVSHHKADAPAYSGAQAVFTAGDWKAGDAAAWEAQMKTRTQTQNEYVRIGSH